MTDQITTPATETTTVQTAAPMLPKSRVPKGAPAPTLTLDKATPAQREAYGAYLRTLPNGPIPKLGDWLAAQEVVAAAQVATPADETDTPAEAPSDAIATETEAASPAEAAVEATPAPAAPKEPKGPNKAVQALLAQGYVRTGEVLPNRKAACERTLEFRAAGKRCCYQTESKTAFAIYLAKPSPRADLKRSAPALENAATEGQAGYLMEHEDGTFSVTLGTPKGEGVGVWINPADGAVVADLPTTTAHSVGQLRDLAAVLLFAADLAESRSA